MSGPADQIDIERAAAADWISRMLTDPRVAVMEPAPATPQLDIVAWATLAVLWATIREVRPDLLPRVGPSVLQQLRRSNDLAGTGLVPDSIVEGAKRPLPPTLGKAWIFAQSLGMVAITMLILLGAFSVFLILFGIFHHA